MHDVRTFDRFARLYDALMWPAEPERIEAGLAMASGDVSLVLDVAGGAGRVSRALDRRSVVVDAAPGMVRRARHNGLAAVVGDAVSLPVRSGVADAVVVADAFHHLPDPDAVVREAFRVLRPGGVLVVREFDPTTLRGRGVVLGERLVGFDSTFWAPADLLALLAEAGFETSLPDTGFGYTAVGVRPKPGDQ
jgi:demethylmenaquinone methyltransferase/2-methoxy-6-polyprenyl-1,4-benzoquinol methylase